MSETLTYTDFEKEITEHPHVPLDTDGQIVEEFLVVEDSGAEFVFAAISRQRVDNKGRN